MERLNKISKIFNKIYYNLFVENFKGKLHYNFPQNYFRWDLIEYLINKYGYSDYLEIGCDQDQLFSKIKIHHTTENFAKATEPVDFSCIFYDAI